MKRNFDKWFANYLDSIATYQYYTGFNIVYKNIDKIIADLEGCNNE